MRRSTGICFWMAMILLAADTRGLAAQTSEPIPAEAAESDASAAEEDTAAQDTTAQDTAAQDTAAQDTEPAPVEPDAGDEAATTAEAAPDWQSELDLITDLLIDGKPLEARGKADQLLQAEGLPDHVASRAQALREKADEKLARSSLAGSEPRPKIEIPARQESGETSEKPAAAKEKSFKIRVAAVGSGFSQGVTGLLYVSEKGLSFVPQGRTREDWAIRWQELTEARNDTGLWDAPYPLVLIERGGRKRYIVRLDQKGSYLPGAPLLTAIAEARRKQKPPQQKSAETEEGR